MLTLDTTAIEKRLWKMRHRIRHVKQVEIGAVMSEWQVDDLHRHRPHTKRARRIGRAETLIRPHSRYEMKRSRKFTAREVRRAKRRNVSPAVLRTSTRPILRAVMDERLQERYQEMMRSIRW
jgi:hypothetical protein